MSLGDDIPYFTSPSESSGAGESICTRESICGSENDSGKDFLAKGSMMEYVVNGEKIRFFEGFLTDAVMSDRPELKKRLDAVMSMPWAAREHKEMVDLSRIIPFLAINGLAGKPCFENPKVVSVSLILYLMLAGWY